jgi:hypothetical protein
MLFVCTDSLMHRHNRFAKLVRLDILAWHSRYSVSGIGSIATLSILPPGFPGFFSSPLRPWLVTFWLSSIVTQIGATALISWKIWSAISWRARKRGSVEWAILRIFVESGALYSAGTVVVLVMYLLQTAAGTIVAGMLGQLSVRHMPEHIEH